MYSVISVVIVLSVLDIYMVYIYVRLVQDQQDLFAKYKDARNKEKVNLNASEVVDKSISNTLRRAIIDISQKISKNSNTAIKGIRSELVKDLVTSHEAEEKAIEGQFDDVKKQIEEYKRQKMQETDAKIEERSKKIVNDVVMQFLNEGFNQEEKEAMLLKMLDNAKRSNLL